MRSRSISRISSVGLLHANLPPDEYVYPQHITRASLDALPNAPGIYIFRDAQQRPLYVGKSVALRTRVLSHLRNTDEAQMLQLTHDIVHQRTAGEIGALLLESQLIKQLQPPFNVMLRQQRSLCSLQLLPGAFDEAMDGDGASAGRQAAGTVQFVLASKYDFARSEHLYGLFSGKHSALEQLRKLIEQHQLCPVQAGLERQVHGRACFSHQIGRCRGACVGLESMQQHQQRLLAALHDLRLLVWPFDGPIGIVEEQAGWRQMHIVNLWCYLGSIDLADGARAAAQNDACFDGNMVPQVDPRFDARFDADTYKILLKPLLSGNLQLDTPPASWFAQRGAGGKAPAARAQRSKSAGARKQRSG